MAADIHKFKDVEIKYKTGNTDVVMHIDLGRLERNFNNAQYALDSQIMNDMVPYMPHNTGTFVANTRAISASLAGSGMVCAAAPPMGRFLYEGKVMVDPETGSPWARPGAKKVTTDRALNYSNPNARPHWFDVAKDKHGKQWVALVKEKVGE